MARDPELLAHQRWLGYVQPAGLVVSPPALLQAQAHLNQDVIEDHRRFLDHLRETPVLGSPNPLLSLKDLHGLLIDILAWQPTDLVPADDPRAAKLEVVLTAYNETLRPTWAVPDEAAGKPDAWLLLIQEAPFNTPLDKGLDGDARHWLASPQDRFERLLRETRVPIGLLCNGTNLRLVYAPPSESVGHLTFPIAAMAEVAGRPIFAALRMLLSAPRLFTLPDKQRLPSILSESRRYQNTVSNELAQQVLAALFELLRGFQAADDHAKGELLRDFLMHEPDQIYAGLVTVLMRLVFLLYAEDRGLMSEDEVYARHYSVTGLFERLREDAGRYPDTMDQRYGAWGQLLALFRMVHDGCKHADFQLPARHGYLFAPDKYPFLEGRPRHHERTQGERIPVPHVSDGTLFRVLQNLLMLDGERISYRTLDVEQIGSVYEAIMGYRLEKAGGRSIALKPKKAHGAPITVNLEELLRQQRADRAKWLKEQAEQKVEGAALGVLKEADSVEALVAALERKIAKNLTPNIVAAGGIILQPSDERRRSGSHYTPRSLTGPIVRKALEPVLQQLGDRPRPEQILGLKVCDPAMGSGAFLVEACRQLGEALLKAWETHGSMPKVPEDETPELFAQRTIAPRCLYGVDKNPMAADLAKLSLWLATLAKEHPFTFLDHSLKCGDSLVGLTLQQIRMFHWNPPANGQMLFGQEELVRLVREGEKHRTVILETGDFTPHQLKEQQYRLADEALEKVRFAGNLVIAAFFAAEKDRDREAKRTTLAGLLGEFYRTKNFDVYPRKDEASLGIGPHPIKPFHWEVEFPEVFGREQPGFDVIVGNPPFLGGSKISSNNGDSYLDWILTANSDSHGNADLVAHFFRRAFCLLRPGGTLGLIATNTIAQGDTRSSGLRWICNHGGTIYAARRRYKWPGVAAVVVSVVHLCKVSNGCRPPDSPYLLDGTAVERITAYLFHAGGNDDAEKLVKNSGKCFLGSKIYGQGFIFEENPSDPEVNPLSLMHSLFAKDPRNKQRVYPYLGGEDLNDSPTHDHHRYVINFGELTEQQARQWPDLMSIVEENVKPGRLAQKRDTRKKYWWRFGETTPALFAAIRGLDRVLTNSQVSPHLAFAFRPSSLVFSHAINVFPITQYGTFCVMQSQTHEVWARFFASSLEDRLRYTPSDCFETFPFPEHVESNENLEAAGKEYYEFRAELMVRNNEGLTKTYNRFHDPNETTADILKLRELHAAMDRAVLEAYGGDLAKLVVPPCEFLLDYEDEEDEDEAPSARQRKKPWRYRWPDAFRDEVLALLLDLNKQRAEQERLAGPAETSSPRRSPRRRGSSRSDQPNLLDPQ